MLATNTHTHTQKLGETGRPYIHRPEDYQDGINPQSGLLKFHWHFAEMEVILKQNWAWGHWPIIPAAGEVEETGSQVQGLCQRSEATLETRAGVETQ